MGVRAADGSALGAAGGETRHQVLLDKVEEREDGDGDQHRGGGHEVALRVVLADETGPG